MRPKTLIYNILSSKISILTRKTFIFSVRKKQGTDRQTDGPTDRPTDTPSYRDARTHLKTENWRWAGRGLKQQE